MQEGGLWHFTVRFASGFAHAVAWPDFGRRRADDETLNVPLERIKGFLRAFTQVLG